jgi:DNA-binding CsgD family transcriptional regulator
MSRPRIHRGRTPDGITPLVAYRSWTLSVDPGRAALHSLNGQIVLEVDLDDPLGKRADPWLVARCLYNDHDAPEESCSCGFYAVKSLSTLEHVLPFATPRSLSLAHGAEPGAATFDVAGRVDLAGKVVEHDLGYRAERMRIAELRPYAGTEQTVERFARRLGVPVGEPVPVPARSTITQGDSVHGSGTMAGGAEPRLHRLTPREVEALDLLASGAPLEEIFERMHTSATVRSLVRHIHEKLRSSTQAKRSTASGREDAGEHGPSRKLPPSP